VYLAVVEIIRERGILRLFPERTEADMYIWIAKHREDLINDLGWEFDTEIVADDLITQYAAGLAQTISRVTERILDAVTPDSLEAGPPAGEWREKQIALRTDEFLFRNILVGISKDDQNWDALNQAIGIAKREQAVLRGLHVVPKSDLLTSEATQKIEDEFHRRCEAAQITGEIAIEIGTAARKICERAQWADLVIGKLTHPPADQLLGRLSSGFRIMVRRCARPILAIPIDAAPMKHVLLAYNGSPKAEEALFIAAYMTSQWQIPLSVLTIQNADLDARSVQANARDYLATTNASVEYFIREGAVVETMLQLAKDQGCDLILIGGYRANPVVEVVQGSVVDEILRETSIPTLICR
jgi:nucleotide-binding universal stress UspA family protein